MNRADLVRMYRSALRRLRELADHYEWCDDPAHAAYDRNEREALDGLAVWLRRAYRACVQHAL